MFNLFFFLRFRHANTFLALFWVLIGTLNVDDMEVHDPAFRTTQEFGRIFVSFYIICMVIVALSMLVAMMNDSFNRIMVSFHYYPLPADNFSIKRIKANLRSCIAPII